MASTLVIIPAYNEEACMVSTVKELTKVAPQSQLGFAALNFYVCRLSCPYRSIFGQLFRH